MYDLETELAQAKHENDVAGVLLRESASALLRASARRVEDALEAVDAERGAALAEAEAHLQAAETAFARAGALANEHGWFQGLLDTGQTTSWRESTARPSGEAGRLTVQAIAALAIDREREQAEIERRARLQEADETLPPSPSAATWVVPTG